MLAKKIHMRQKKEIFIYLWLGDEFRYQQAQSMLEVSEPYYAHIIDV